MKTKPKKSLFKKYLPLILLAGIIALAVFFRFYQLNTLPPGLHPDEAANGLDIFSILENQDFRIIYNTNGPREALFFYLQAVFVFFMGNTILALRIAPALFGVASVVVIYLATKAWFNRRTALLAAFFMAVNPWVVTIQRDGFRASLVPLFLGLFLWLGAKAYKTNKTIYYILSAIALGLGFYTYSAFTMVLPALLLGFIYMLILRRDYIKQNWKKLLLSFVVFGLVMGPLIYTTIKDPGGSTARAGGTSFLNKDLNNGQPIQTLLSGTAKTLLQYNYIGDENSRHNTPGQPLLNVFVGLMFVLGIVMCLFNLSRPRYVMLLIVLGAMMLPALLTAEGLPHGLRSIGTAVPVFMLAGMGANYLLYIWYRTFPVNKLARATGLIMICTLLALTLVQSYRQYFVAWAQDSRTFEAYSEGSVEVAKYLIANSRSGSKNLVLMGGYEANPIQYLTHNKVDYELIDEKRLQDLPIEGPINQIIIIPAGPDADKRVAILRAKFPKGTVTNVNSNFNDKYLFSVFRVKQ